MDNLGALAPMARQRRGPAAPWPPGLAPPAAPSRARLPAGLFSKRLQALSHKAVLSTPFSSPLHPLHGLGRGLTDGRSMRTWIS